MRKAGEFIDLARVGPYMNGAQRCCGNCPLDKGAGAPAPGDSPVLLRPDIRVLDDFRVLRDFGLNERSELRGRIATGAWYDPDEDTHLERHGNPNVLALDIGTSRLTQGSSALSALVEVERWQGEAPAVRAHQPPIVVASA